MSRSKSGGKAPNTIIRARPPGRGGPWATTTITFSFRTGKRGTYRWQCFVPCAAGFILGFGGPMQTMGWMDGLLEVV